MLSWPPATTMVALPEASRSWPNIAAFRPEPQTLWMVVQATPSGRPAPSAAWRAGAALAGLQHVAHDDFVDLLGLDAGALDGRLDGDRAEFVRGQAGQAAQHAAHGRAGDGNDNDGI